MIKSLKNTEPVTHAIKINGGNGGIFSLSTRWRRMVSLTTRPHYPGERADGTRLTGE